MNDFMKEDLIEYISIRRNAIDQLIHSGVAPGIIDSIEMHKMHGILEELKAIEDWFNE